MLKRLVCILFYILLPLYSFGQDNKKNTNNFNEDYFVGLKAFEDGFYDVSRESLKAFISSNKNSKDEGYATYILYQVYMAENNFKNAQITYNQLSNYKDKRFDAKKLESDKMFLATKLDCNEAENLLLSKINNDWLNIYLNSQCKIDENIIKYSLNNQFSVDNLYLLADKVENNKEYTLLIYNNLPNDKKSPKVLNYFGKYFSAHKMLDEFWKLYDEYKDEDIVSLALNEAWDKKDYKTYVNLYNRDIKKEYKLDKSIYCRMIESSNNIGIALDCNIIDNCLDKNRPDFIKNKIACLMKNEDKQGISSFMATIKENDAKNLCEYLKYMVAKNIYSTNFLSKFSSCKDNAIYETLYNYKDYKGLINLIGKNKRQIDLAYLSMAYKLSGKDKEAKDIIKNITDLSLLEMIKNRTGLLK